MLNMSLLSVILVSLALRSATGFVLDSGPRKVEQILKVGNGGTWGTWRDAQFCPTGAYVIGYSLEMEDWQHSNDDTALNAVRLHCGFLETDGYGGDITSGMGAWGHWTVDETCPKHQGQQRFITSFEMQVETPQGGGNDDTAANYVRFKCRDYSGALPETVVEEGSYKWGSFGGWSASCPANTAVCGLRTRIEAPLGSSGDDTALNDLVLYCCSD